MINNNVRDVQISCLLQFYSQVFQSKIFGKNTKKKKKGKISLNLLVTSLSSLFFYMKLSYYFFFTYSYLFFIKRDLINTSFPFLFYFMYVCIMYLIAFPLRNPRPLKPAHLDACRMHRYQLAWRRATTVTEPLEFSIGFWSLMLQAGGCLQKELCPWLSVLPHGRRQRARASPRLFHIAGVVL